MVMALMWCICFRLGILGLHGGSQMVTVVWIPELLEHLGINSYCAPAIMRGSLKASYRSGLCSYLRMEAEQSDDCCFSSV